MSASAALPVQSAGTPDAIRVENISKSFGVVTALEDVSLHVRAGEVLGLIGDNGAGKSTLVKILTGFHKPDAGRIFVHGDEVQLKSVTHARSLGTSAPIAPSGRPGRAPVSPGRTIQTRSPPWPAAAIE